MLTNLDWAQPFLSATMFPRLIQQPGNLPVQRISNSMLRFKKQPGAELNEKYLTRVEREQRKHALAESERRPQNLHRFAFGTFSLEPGMQTIFRDTHRTNPSWRGQSVSLRMADWAIQVRTEQERDWSAT